MTTDLDALHSSATADWHTPPIYTDAARAVMGHITLDPASCAAANVRVRAYRFFTADDDGLTQSWGRANSPELVWCNPPYGKTGAQSNQALWSAKLLREYAAGHVEQAILLVNAQTGEKWFGPLWEYTICFTRRRIRFLRPDGTVGNGPTHGSAFVYLGANNLAFAREFAIFGEIIPPRWARKRWNEGMAS